MTYQAPFTIETAIDRMIALAPSVDSVAQLSTAPILDHVAWIVIEMPSRDDIEAIADVIAGKLVTWAETRRTEGGSRDDFALAADADELATRVVDAALNAE